MKLASSIRWGGGGGTREDARLEVANGIARLVLSGPSFPEAFSCVDALGRPLAWSDDRGTGVGLEGGKVKARLVSDKVRHQLVTSSTAYTEGMRLFS